MDVGFIGIQCRYIITVMRRIANAQGQTGLKMYGVINAQRKGFFDICCI